MMLSQKLEAKSAYNALIHFISQPVLTDSGRPSLPKACGYFTFPVGVGVGIDGELPKGAFRWLEEP
jgi:hypothetical protein